MIDDIARFFLSFSHSTTIIPFFIFGYIWLSKDIFYRATCLILFNMIFNCALKVTFQIPLSPKLNKEGFAFPSGHMQSSIVFYGWLILKTNNIFFRFVMILLLAGIAFGLMYFGYHNHYDILGAIFFAFLLMSCYSFLICKKPSIIPITMFLLSTILMVYIDMSYKIMSHLWMAYYGLSSFMLSEIIFGEKNNCDKVQGKVIATTICLISYFMVKMFFSARLINTLPESISQIQWAIIGFTIPISTYIANYSYIDIKKYNINNKICNL